MLGLVAATTLVVGLVGPSSAVATVTTSEAASGGPSTSGYLVSPYSSLTRRVVRLRVDAMAGWAGEQQGAQVASVDVRLSRTVMTAPRQTSWVYPPRLQGMAIRDGERHQGNLQDRKVVRLPVAQGQVMCASTRATDTLGNVGEWEQQQCVVRFLDDRRLERHGDVRTLKDRRYWKGAASGLERSGALVVRGVPRGARMIVLWGHGREKYVDGDVEMTGRAARGRVVMCRAGAWHDRPVYGRRETCAKVPARRGAVRLRAGRVSPTVAVEGVAVLPPWAVS